MYLNYSLRIGGSYHYQVDRLSKTESCILILLSTMRENEALEMPSGEFSGGLSIVLCYICTLRCTEL